MSSKKLRAAHMKICHSSLKNASDEPTVDDLGAIVEHDREIGNSQYAKEYCVISFVYFFSVYSLFFYSN